MHDPTALSSATHHQPVNPVSVKPTCAEAHPVAGPVISARPYDPDTDAEQVAAIFASRGVRVPPPGWMPAAGGICVTLDGVPVGFGCVWLTASGRAFLDEGIIVPGLSRPIRERVARVAYSAAERACRSMGVRYLSTITSNPSVVGWLLSEGYRATSGPDQQSFTKIITPIDGDSTVVVPSD